MSTPAYHLMPLNELALVAADDLNQFYGNRQQPVDSVRALVGVLRGAALPHALPSVAAPVLAALRLSTRGGSTASAEAIREFSGFVADRLTTAIRTQPPRDEYQYLIGLCLRLSDNVPVARQRLAAPPPSHHAQRPV